MSYYQGNDLRKPSGGHKARHHKVKRKYELGRPFTETRLGHDDKRKVSRVRGGNIKVRARIIAFANVTDPEKGVTRKTRILRVLENKANPHYTRRNIIVKGTVIETELGKAVVTSRPGQDGVVNAVLTRS